MAKSDLSFSFQTKLFELLKIKQSKESLTCTVSNKTFSLSNVLIMIEELKIYNLKVF